PPVKQAPFLDVLQSLGLGSDLCFSGLQQGRRLGFSHGHDAIVIAGNQVTSRNADAAYGYRRSDAAALGAGGPVSVAADGKNGHAALAQGGGVAYGAVDDDRTDA